MEIGEETLQIMNTVPWYNQWLFSFVKNHTRGKILEVGTRIGNFIDLLKKKGQVTSVDIEERYIQKLKRKYAKGVDVGLGDIEKGKMFFGNKKTFNTIICLNVLEHINDHEQALKNMYKLLESGGKLVLLVPAHQFAFGTLDINLGHFRRYTTASAERFLTKAGFNIVEKRYLNLIGIFGWYINSVILQKKLLPNQQLHFFDKIARPFLFLEKFIHPPMGLSVFIVGEKR